MTLKKIQNIQDVIEFIKEDIKKQKIENDIKDIQLIYDGNRIIASCELKPLVRIIEVKTALCGDIGLAKEDLSNVK